MENQRPLEIVENEFIEACQRFDNAKIIELMLERSDIVVFFCSAAIIRGCTDALRNAVSEFPEELQKYKLIVTRMAKPGRGSVFSSVQQIKSPMVIGDDGEDENLGGDVDGSNNT